MNAHVTRAVKLGKSDRATTAKEKKLKTTFIFAIDKGGSILDNHWILDSGSSRHLVNGPSLLIDPTNCQSECLTAATDEGVLHVTKQVSVNIEGVVLEVVNTIRLLDVQYAANIERIIISYGKLEAKG